MNTFDPFISSEYLRNLKDETPLESAPTLTKKTESQFLSQILSYPITGPIKAIAENTETFTIIERQSQNCKIEQNSSSNTSSENSNKSSSKNSPFHNFQKHLVITLRQILTLHSLSLKGGVETDLAEKIFVYFKKSQKTSRNFLEQVFGLFQNKDSQSCSQFISSIRLGQLKQILEPYDDETIIGAQTLLKHLTRSELQQYDLQETLSHRKIQKKQQFIEYINLFKKELLEGKQRKKTYKLLAKKFNNQ